MATCSAARRITYRKTAAKWAIEMFPPAIEECFTFFDRHYPGVNLSRVAFELAAGGQKSRYYPRGRRSCQLPLVLVSPDGAHHFYARACRELPGLIDNALRAEDRWQQLMLPLVHEMTHHLQRVRGFHGGNETDTTQNTLMWLFENDREAFAKCWVSPPMEFEPAAVMPGAKRPWYRLPRQTAAAPYWSCGKSDKQPEAITG